MRATLFVALAIAGAGGNAAATAREPETAVNVFVVNSANVRPEVLSTAQAHATAVYRAARVRLRWVGQQVAEPSGAQPVDFTVTIVSRQGADTLTRQTGIPEETLGFAAMDVGGRAEHGRIAYVFYNRVEDYAGKRQLPVAGLLGRVMGHELGHLMLGVGSHAESGIMRAHPNERTTLLEYFTADQAAAVRENLSMARR